MQWYYDFISPFAYLQSTRLSEFADDPELTLKPVLFAGLLQHWGSVGPAEIPPKRDWTFQHVVWLAARDGIEFRLPPYHPFNPLPLLRLAIVLDNELAAVQRIFRYVWAEGKVPQDDDAFQQLLTELAVKPQQLDSPAVKQSLRDNGEAAIAQGVFGVPTFVAQNQAFWGYDATDMVHAYRQAQAGDSAAVWPADDLRAVLQLPEGQGRKRH